MLQYLLFPVLPGLAEESLGVQSSIQVIQQMKDEITFLHGHLSQLSEKLPAALPPSQEEAQKKGWWQFWK